MKKTLAMTLGAILLAGSAVPASAASEIDFSGYYDVYFMNDVNLGKRVGDAAFTDSFLGHRLNIDLTFRATDEISVYWRLRAPDFKRFGNTSYSGNDGQGRTAMVTHHIYGQIDQAWGTLRIGQIDDAFDSFGLGSLGYSPATDPAWTNRSPFDTGGRIDGIHYSRSWDNGFGLIAMYQKGDNNDQMGLGDPANVNRSSDQDVDAFLIEPRYEWDGGGTALGLSYQRDAAHFDGVQDVGTGYDNRATALSLWALNPAVMHSWGNFSMHLEGLAVWGAQDFDYLDPTIADDDASASGYAFYLDGDYNYGPGNVTLAGWWSSGSNLDDIDNKGFGSDIDQGNFYPLLVAFNGDASGWGRESDNAVSLANDGFENFVAGGFYGETFLNDAAGVRGSISYDSDYNEISRVSGNFTNFMDAVVVGSRTVDDLNGGTNNHWAIALTGNHALSDDIALHYGLAYLALNNPTYSVATAGNVNDLANTMRYSEQEKDLGVEADLSFSFQLLDNLQYVTSFGYMFNGDAYKSLRGYTIDASDNVEAVWDDPEDSYVWYNTLSFSF
ncbi:MAG: porin [Candidatus Adiutrix sp.]|nr:porin [Candidatus Adiutrix sp.]